MPIVDIDSARESLSELIDRACAGEEVTIARGAQPVVKLVPLDPPRPRRHFGALRGELLVPPEFFEPLSDDEIPQ